MSAAKLKVDATLPVPIWSQIEDGVRHLVASRVLEPGDPLPSVRDLARDQRINPNTVAKAYQRLADAGVLETRRGEGTFVAEKPPALPAGERDRVLREAASRYASFASTVGATRTDALGAVQAAWPDGQPVAKGGRR
jgi:DNA-binding transcriptional regulator YhcF (GntR family)